MINAAAKKYAATAPSSPESEAGTYFPDAVIDALASEARSVTADLFAAHLADPEKFGRTDKFLVTKSALPLEKSKELIINALHGFDPKLGQKADEILNDPARLNIRDVPPGNCKVMQCRPAESTIEGAENPLPYAVIDYEYDHTIGTAIYLAHELGHAIADDYLRESGHSYRDTPVHMIETQAYLVQHIVYDALKTHTDPEIASQTRNFAVGDMFRNIYDLSLSLASMDALHASQNGQTINPAVIFGNRVGQNWEKFVENHSSAGRIFDAISTLADTKDPDAVTILENEFKRLHDRPAGILTTAGLVACLRGQDQETKTAVSEMLLGRNGPKDIREILAAAGIKDEKQLQNLAQSALQSSASSLKNIVPRQTGADISKFQGPENTSVTSSPIRHSPYTQPSLTGRTPV